MSSPDGAYVVLKPRWKSLLLVNVATLETTILAKAHPYLETPVAWSLDSRFVAFAPPDTDCLQVFSVDRRVVVSTITGTGSWVHSLSWSPDTKHIASVEWRNRRMNKTPFGLIGAFAGHPEFRNDAILSVYQTSSSQHISYVLERGISEMSSSNIVMQWK